MAEASESGRTLDRGARAGIHFPLFGRGQLIGNTKSAALDKLACEHSKASVAKILVIDDEDIVLSVIGQSLERVGHQVFASKTIEEGLSHAANLERIDLLILNHSIEGIKGREVADRIRAQHPAVKTLRISGYPREKLVAEGNIRPDAEFLRKPFLPEVLRYKVEKLLTRPAPGT